jgi:hypothetical protein
MNFLLRALFRRVSDKGKKTDQAQPKLNAATARNVLNFLNFGLTYGAASLRDRYRPGSKVNEFVAVSEQMLRALKQHYDARLSSDSVILSMHINDLPKQITLTGVGQNVMLVLDGSSALITHTTLSELYINLRNDVIAHGEIYGTELQSLAQSFSEPG